MKYPTIIESLVDCFKNVKFYTVESATSKIME